MKLLSGILGLTLSSVAALASANAADMYRASEAGGYKDGYAPTAVWTGFYAGVNAGYESANWQARPTLIDPGFIQAYQAYLPPQLTKDFSDSGALGGFQIGYNYQSGRLVLGVEADYDFSDLKASRDTGVIAGPFPTPVHNAQFTEKADSQNLATVRGRLGAAFDNFLIYGTGGLAVTAAHFSPGVTLLNGTQPYSGSGASETKTGWVAGGGVEFMLNSAWSIKAEYLHADFGSESARLADGAGAVIDSKASLTTDTVRGGINYHVGNVYEPLK
jgi:outer membrane immunogenic protein